VQRGERGHDPACGRGHEETDIQRFSMILRGCIRTFVRLLVFIHQGSEIALRGYHFDGLKLTRAHSRVACECASFKPRGDIQTTYRCDWQFLMASRNYFCSHISKWFTNPHCVMLGYFMARITSNWLQ
jgi:hypothetical protein